MRQPGAFSGILLFVLLAWGTPLARAQSDEDARTAQAERLFNDGVAASERGDFQAALRAFQSSYDLNPVPDVLYNIGMCHKALGNAPGAANAFQQYVLAVGGDMTADERAEFEALLQELVPQVGRLAVQATETGAMVQVDGTNVGTTPLQGWYAVEPGSHAVTVTRDGFAPASTVIDVPAGALVPLNMTLVATGETPAGPGTEEGPATVASGGGLSPWFWVSVGVTGAATVGMAITGGLTLKYKDDYINEGQDDADLRDMTLTMRTTTDVLLGVALAGAIAGTLLLIFGGDEETSDEAASPVTASLAPSGLLLAW
jgi:hypothetical protein